MVIWKRLFKGRIRSFYQANECVAIIRAYMSLLHYICDLVSAVFGGNEIERVPSDEFEVIIGIYAP